MRSKISFVVTSILVAIMLVLAVQVNYLIPQPDDMVGQDIYYSFVEGQRLQEGQNPYSRILTGDMLQNHKYATYFPVFYELSSISEALGLRVFRDWMAFWRIVFMFFELATALLLQVAFARRRLEWVGVLAVGFWLFNRWSLLVVQTENMDFIPIFFLLLSLELFPRRKGLSLFAFGVSLGFKQIAIFLLPLYLIWIYRSSAREWVKSMASGLVLVGSVPFVAALPFLFWDAKGFVKSVLFSVTRVSDSLLSTKAIDSLLGWTGPMARIVMFAFLLLAYLVVWRGHGEKYVACLIVMLVFIAFNTSLFGQYQLWSFALAPLVFCDLYELARRSRAGPAGPHETSPLTPLG